jgi:hypothetical protein
MPTSARTASNDAVNPSGPVADEEPELRDAITQIHHQVADLLGSPSTIWVRGRAEQVHGSAGYLQYGRRPSPSFRANSILSLWDVCPGRVELLSLGVSPGVGSCISL